jgi:hypothetical protein
MEELHFITTSMAKGKSLNLDNRQGDGGVLYYFWKLD